MTERLTFDEGLALFERQSTLDLQKRAQIARFAHNPRNVTTFVLDTNPNYTNVCTADCSFCAFYRKPGHKESYTKTIDQVMEHLAIAKRAGISTVLLQGGLHPDLHLSYFTQLVRTARERFPEIFPHFFSAPEIYQCAQVSGCSVDEVLSALFDAGQRTLPGGGAEILSESVRLRISPKKMEPGAWLAIHEAAHRIGFKSTATMMFGHVESSRDLLIHLSALRDLQDKTGGFTAFIPWSYKRDNTALRRRVLRSAGEEEYLRIIAFSRIYLDNFPHVQATWFSEGKATGIKALQFGADDFGGTLLEENVHKAANHVEKTHLGEVLAMIRQAGFTPAERDPLYRIRREFPQSAPLDVAESSSRFSLNPH